MRHSRCLPATGSPGSIRFAPLLVFVLVTVAAAAAAQGTKTITFADIMRFRAIDRPVISDDGAVIAYGAQPDRGDGEAIVHIVGSGKTISVPRGSGPTISKDGRFVAMTVRPSFAASESADKDKARSGLAIVDVGAGRITTVDAVERFALSDDGRWLAYLLAAETEPATGAKPAAKPAGAGAGQKSERKPGTTLKLRELASGAELPIPFVTTFGFDPSSRFLAYAVADKQWLANGLFVRALGDRKAQPSVVTRAKDARYDSLVWTKDGRTLAAVATTGDSAAPGSATLWTWSSETRQGRQALTGDSMPVGWVVPFKNELRWSKDGARLFLGLQPGNAKKPAQKAEAKKTADPDPYDFERILSKVELDVWHWQDPRIQPQQKVQWEREKDRTYRAVFHAGSGKLVQLAALDLPDVEVPGNAEVALGTSALPYLRETTWDEGYRDVYTVSLADGSRTLVTSRLGDRAALSPDGRTIVYFRDKAWHLYDCRTKAARNVSTALKARFDDELHDTPDTPPAYGFGGWVDDGASVLIYDRFDVWLVPADGKSPVNLTGGEGRKRQITFRVVETNPSEPGIRSGEPVLLTAYHDREKNWGFYTTRVGSPGVEPRLDEKRRFRFVAKAKAADLVMYTRETYAEFPDLWVADGSFRQSRKISNVNPQIAEFAWGATELVEYTNADGVPLQGVLIKPANYQAGRRYPVITYFYERQSQRLYEWNEAVVNHRPSFAVYSGSGYAVFLPDIVFEVGHPGQSILKSVVPAVQKLVDMGIADPNALGIHGHSWGGYGTAYLVTQTAMFKAAVAGAPVANMTSAYGGIRWESGLARLFQYEKTQSRIGGSLWEYPLRFLENSALFSADRVTTPLLIQHGDEDGAVPWYQAIELYLAMRRLGKDCIFLQYRGEPHHLRKYPNKLDYSIKMKEYFDHYLKGAAAPEWIKAGVPYKG